MDRTGRARRRSDSELDGPSEGTHNQPPNPKLNAIEPSSFPSIVPPMTFGFEKIGPVDSADS